MHVYTCIHTTHKCPFLPATKFSFMFNTQLLNRLMKLYVYWHRFCGYIYNRQSLIQRTYTLERQKHWQSFPCHFLSASSHDSDCCMCSSRAPSDGSCWVAEHPVHLAPSRCWHIHSCLCEVPGDAFWYLLSVDELLLCLDRYGYNVFLFVLFYLFVFNSSPKLKKDLSFLLT